MCLAVPGKIVEFTESEAPFASAIVDFGGVRRHVSTSCVAEAKVGDYLMVHAGIAISIVNEREAARILEALEQIGIQDEVEPLTDHVERDAGGAR
jgi:hydrogenase expression/formation protein HypC